MALTPVRMVGSGTGAILFCSLPLCGIGGAEMKHANRRLGIFERVEAEILAGHGGFAGKHIFFTERALEGGSDTARQFRIVDGSWHMVRGGLDDGSAIR